MITLGMSAFGQNPAAALLVDGKLIAFAEEERFIRQKSATGKFPSWAIRYCLKEAGVTINDVTTVAIGWDATKYSTLMPLLAAKLWIKNGVGRQSGVFDSAVHELLLWRPENVTTKILFALRQLGLKNKRPRIRFIPHHDAHAASTFYASGFDDATVLVLDGSGEERATTTYKGTGKKLIEMRHIDIPDSLGWFYAAATAYLGFTPYEEDGFVMGLAPYGKPSDAYQNKVSKILRRVRNGEYTVDPAYTLLGTHTRNEHFSDEFVKLFGAPRLPNEPITSRHKAIAYAIQDELERTIVHLAEEGIRNTGIRNLCLAGGVALNSKTNGKLAYAPFVDKLFIQPASHDAGTALGAAMIASVDQGEDPRFLMYHSRWGPSFTEGHIKQTLDEAGISYKQPSDISQTIARSIADGRIVARFQGRMEAGPRALGGRSILADATKKNMNDIVNNRVKHRDPWRPFCPSMTNDAAKILLTDPKESRFMTVIYDVTDKAADIIPSVTHIDGTTRPQTVSKPTDPEYHRLLKHIEREIGTAVVMNTSFNVKGEPIVNSPMDALRCFFSTGIDALAIETFWVEKQLIPKRATYFSTRNSAG